MQIFTEKLKVPDERSPEGNAYVIMGFVEKAMDMAYNATGDEVFNKDAKKSIFSRCDVF